MTTPLSVRKLRSWPVASLLEFDRNPRQHPEDQIEDLVALIREVGFLVPPVVDEARRVILAGHARIEAARRLEMDKVPVIPVGHLSHAQQIAFVIADNRMAERSSWDRVNLAQYESELLELGFDATLTGFSREEIDELLAELEAQELPEEEGPVPDPPVRPKSTEGDVWILGKHRVMCGDSTCRDQVEALTEGSLVDIVWTDPPYNVDYHGKAGTLLNDGLPQGEFDELLAGAFGCMIQVMKKGAPAYVAYASAAEADFVGQFLRAGFKLSATVVWVKNILVLGHGDYHYRHEPILYGWKPGARHRWFGPANETTAIAASDAPFVQVGDDEWQIQLGETTLIVKGKDLSVREVHGDVFFENKPVANQEHPTMKPVPLIERMLRNSARAGGTIYDPFGGSGSTMIAGERRRMAARIMELSPAYTDVIVQRWQNLTGRQAHHAETQILFDDVKPRRRRSA